MPQPVKLIALLKFKRLKGYRVNIAIDEYQEIDGERAVADADIYTREHILR